MSQGIQSYLRWLDAGISPYHCVETAAETLSQAGFAALDMAAPFALARGGKYYVKNGSFLAAFAIGAAPDHFRIAAAHTDWPCLKIKPDPEQVTGGCCKLSVEPYGGAILNTWMDRPLSLAGTVLLKGEKPMKPVSRLIAWEEPLLTIPNLAIHLNREVNKGVATKPQVDLLPLCRLVEEGWNKNGYLLQQMAEKLGCDAEDILSFDLCVYCCQKAQLLGFDKKLLSAPRIDNISSCHACITALTEADCKGISVAVLYDNEEIGSNTRRGGDSNTLSTLLEKIALSLGMDRASYLDACLKGMLLSCDVAHALHPNHPEMADRSCAPKLGCGVALKQSPRYSTEAQTAAVVQGLCKEKNIPLQLYMNRPDLPGGSTIGSMASALLTMPGADVGAPILAMHSACELMGAEDQEALCRLCKAFYEAG